MTLATLRVRYLSVEFWCVNTSQKKTMLSQETVQIIVSRSENFPSTQDMLQMDEETTQKNSKDIDQLDLALPKVPTKALYKLQVNVTQDI
jgi:hypothetical protein